MHDLFGGGSLSHLLESLPLATRPCTPVPLRPCTIGGAIDPSNEVGFLPLRVAQRLETSQKRHQLSLGGRYVFREVHRLDSGGDLLHGWLRRHRPRPSWLALVPRLGPIAKSGSHITEASKPPGLRAECCLFTAAWVVMHRRDSVPPQLWLC